MFLLYANDFSFNIQEAEYVYAQTIQICWSPGQMKKGGGGSMRKKPANIKL